MLLKENVKLRLTTPRVEKFRVEDKTQIVWDDRLPAFGLRVSPTGSKTYFLQYRVGKNGRQVGKSIGRHRFMSCERARAIASEWLLQAQDGRDPNALCALDDGSNPTVAEFGERYLAEHSNVHKKPNSIILDEDFLRRIIIPRIGTIKIRDLTRYDIQKVHSSLSKTPQTANLVRGLISHMCSMAEAWGVRPDHSNPCRHIKKYPVKARVRYLTDDELPRLAAELRACQKRNTIAADYFRVLLLTGCRCGEIRSLMWSDINFDLGFINLRDSKNGARKVPVADVALAVLKKIKRVPGNPHVFPGKKPGSHTTTFKTSWTTIRRNAGLVDFHAHDLRHHFGTTAGRQGVPMKHVQGLMGHSSSDMTDIYVHAVPEDQLTAANTTANAIARTLAMS